MKPYPVYQLYDIRITRGLGSRLWDKNGRSYLDLYGGHAVISIGHSHPHYIRRVSNQLKQLGFYSNAVHLPLQEELAETLGKMSGYPDYDLFLCNSGAEANENALKLAGFKTGRSRVIAFEGAFHGRTSLAVAATDNAKIRSPLNQQHDICFLPMNDVTLLEATLNEEVAAVIIEGIQGVAGILEPTASFLQKLRSLCTQYGIVLILDEVQSGYGRTGQFFAHQHASIQADLITVAKGMGNGFPIAGVLISPDFNPVKESLGTTFGGNPLACAAALAVLEVIQEENLLREAAQKGQYLREQLSGIPGITEIRGRGLLLGISTTMEAARLRKNLLDQDQIFTGSAARKDTIRLLPALNVSENALDYFINAISTHVAVSIS